MKKTNKLISILLVLAMLLSMAPLSLTASAADIEVYATGTLGSGSRTAWTIYDNGLLVIDGKGNSVSTKWDSTTASPWKDYADIITRVSFVNCENWECIPECTFRSLSKLKDVTLPENIEEICQYAFTGTAIETILLPDGLITIGYYAFSSCESLKYININDGVTSIGSSAFYNCSSLKAISIPDSVTSIGQTLFQNCTNLEYVRLSENADKVGGSMFSGCTMLKNVSLPASVTVIGSKAFSNASNLEGVYYHGVNEPTTYNPGINNATFSLAPDTMVIYASNDYSATTMGLKANWENDVQTVTKIEGHFVNIAHTANGAVKVGASIVPAGDTVTIDIMAYKNYELDTITVTDSNGQVELSGSGHSRTFSMPEGDVRISATFKSTATPHVHSWTYAANGATITATCAYADTCHNPISKVEISKGNTSSLTFRPDNAKYMTVSGTMEDVVIPDLVYTLKSTGEPTTPINPGVYVASLTIENVTATYEFEITRGNFNYTYFTYTAPQNLTYDGTPKYASVVMSEDYVPYAGEYTVYYNSGTTEPINAGTYTVKVNVAESDYFTAGTALSGRAWRFTIAPKSIEDLTYEGLGTSYPVGATPDVTIKHGDMVLVKDTDYTVEYANNTELGTATMTVTGVGNYTGSKTLEFEIVPHTHSFTYSASGDTITAVCENTDGNCPDPEGTLTILAPADLYVDGITAKEATVENNLVDTSVAISEITYSAPYGLPPKDAGTYTASVTVGGATATVEFTLLNYAAKVTDKDGNKLSGSPYKTLAEAVTAASASEGSTVTLLDDVTLTKQQDIRSGKLTLDLNGKNLINENGRVLYIYEEADLTIKDSSETGTLERTDTGGYAISNNGTLTVESGIIKGDGGIDNKGTLTFKDGTAEAVTYPAIYNTGTAYVYDGVLKHAKSFALGNNGTLYVYDGEIDGVSNNGTAYISGGEIDCDNHAALNLLVGTVEVTGGSFTGTDLASGYFSGTPYGEWTVRYNEDATLTLKGGEFPNGFVVAYTTANTFLADGYAFYDKDGNKITVADDAKIIDGYVQVKEYFVASVTDKDGNELEGSPYKTFADAITAAQGSEGSILTLLDDITLTAEQVIRSGEFTLDLNGKNLINENGRVLYIFEEADLTIKDSGEGGTVHTNGATSQTIFNCGTLTIENGLFKGAAGIVTSGTLNFKNGKIEADTYDAIRNSGTVYIYNGSFTSIDAGAINVDTDGTAYIYGGEFSGFCGISNSGTAYIEGGEFKGNSYAAFNLYSGTVEVTGGSFTGNDNEYGSFTGIPYGEWTVRYDEGANLTLKGGEFPGGFVTYKVTANALLAEDYYYKDADGKLIDVADDAKIINGYVKVSKGADLADAVITLDKTQFTYSGTEHKPTVIVTVGGKTLTEGKDYTLTFANNVNAGIATVTVRGISQAAGGIAGGGEDIGNSSNSGDITESIYTGKIIKNFTIKPATVDIIWEGDSFYYTGNPHKVTAKYVDVNGDENPAAITQNKTNTEIGKYIATAVVEDSNYTANSVTANHAYEIKWYDGAPDATVSGTKGENGWYTSAVTVTAPEGYTISTAVDGIYGSEITFGNEENAVYYLKQTENGYIAKVELGEIKQDLADPTAEIVIGEYKWNTNATAISFGLFFKETKAFSVIAEDTESGVAKIEYLVATEEITDFTNVEWAEYTDAVIITPNSKNIIYAKVTDISGRYIIVNSDGIVLYTDSTLDTSFKDEIVYVLTKNASQSFNLNLNGNTVAYVKIGETVLGTEDYEVLGNMILVSADVLENLAAGNYAITIGFNPMGETFVDGDAPADVTIPLTVKKADVKIEISDFGKVYDGKPVTADYKISKSSDSSPAVSYIDYNETVEYKVKGANDSTYTTEVPVNAGEYTVRITVAETDKINSAEATADFIIEKREVTATATAPDKVYDGTVNLDFSKVVITFDGIVDGDDVSYEIMGGAYVSANVAEKVRVAVSYDVSGMDVSNYEFGSGAAIPEAKYYSVMTFASIVAKDISDGFIILGEPLTYNGTEQTQTVEKVLPTGTAPEATYTVSGNKATNVGVYLLTVTGTGNFTGEAKIAYEIAVDMNGVDFDQLHVFNVKSTDKERIEYIYNQVHNASTEYADEEKKEEWFILLNNSNELLLMINNVTSHLESYKEEVAGYDIDTVTSDDYDYLESLSESEGQWLFDHSENYTEEEIIEFSQVNAALTKLLIRISDVAKEITRITNAVNSYDEATVKSSDKEDLEQLKADIKALTDGQNITDGEREKLAELDAKLDELIKRIDDTAEEIERIENAVNGYDEESVKSTDKEAINKLKDDIQNLIDSGNVTEEEIADLEDIKADADALTDKITETEQQLENIKDIENGYNPETVTSDDKAAIEDKIAEIEAVNPDNLTDEQKAEYEEIKAGYEALLEEIAAAEKAVADIGAELEMFDEKRVTIFWKDEIEALKAKIDELLADENMGEAEKARLNEYKAQCDKLIEIINTPVKYFSLRFFYLIWDFLVWVFNGILWVFSKIFSC